MIAAQVGREAFLFAAGDVALKGVFSGAAKLLGRSVVEESAQSIISRTAQAQANRGVNELRGIMSSAQRAAFDANPARGTRFLGTAIHEETAAALERAYPLRFEYNTVGPDFLDKATGELIELTTPRAVGAHMAKKGYDAVTYATYNLTELLKGF